MLPCPSAVLARPLSAPRWVVVAALALGACATPGAPSTSPAPREPAAARKVGPPADRPSLAERTTLGPDVRARLRVRMERHGVAMSDLVWSVILLDHERTGLIAAEIGLWETVAGEGTEGVPLRFFALEQALRAETDTLGRLARAADAQDPEVGRSFARLSTICVDCHSTYLYGETSAPLGLRELLESEHAARR